MKRLIKAAMMAVMIGLAFNANADNKIEKAERECAFAAEIYDIRYGDGMGYLEIMYDAACRYKAVVPFLGDEIAEKFKLHEKYKDLVDVIDEPELLKAVRDGEVKGFAIHHRIKAGA